LARFLTEHHLANGRPVVAHDLADETPQLADFLPGHVASADISDICGQMAPFDGLIAQNGAPKVIDVGHRAFGPFFAIVHKIGLFEEARRRGIEPVILFMIDPDPKAEKAYSLLRRSFPGTALLPARNGVAGDIGTGAAAAIAGRSPRIFVCRFRPAPACGRAPRPRPATNS
jgi:hypothetical protein